MNLEELKNRIKPELESVFGGTMTNLILTKAKMKVASEGKSMDEGSRCRIFIECLSSDEKLIGMWGSLEAKERTSKWLDYIG
jgi:hypothetical protein